MTNINFPDNPSDGDRVGLQVYNATRGVWEWDALSGDTTAEDLLGPTQNLSYLAEFLVIGGGGPGGWGGNTGGGGGGAGGYIESSFLFSVGTTLDVTIGAGGTAPKAGPYTNGNDSQFGDIGAHGGGFAGGYAIEGLNTGPNYGGSGGGGRTSNQGGASSIAITIQQGNSGGTASTNIAGGGGGAGSSGVSGSSTGNGGAGITSSITGSAVGRAGGGGAGARDATAGIGTDGGGNGGRVDSVGTTPGDPNTGGGGGGGGSNRGVDRGGANGGSGVVIFKIPQELSTSFSVGLTEENGGSGQTVGSYKVYTVTAGTGTVTIS